MSYKDDEDYANYLYELIKNMGLNPWIFIKKDQGKPTAREVTFNSLRFLEFLKEYLYWEEVKTYFICLSRTINFYNKDFLFGFVRGAMDTDGYVGSSNIVFGVVSKNFTKNIQRILSLININTTIKIKKKKKDKDLHIIRINKKDLVKYNKYMGFSNPRKQQKLLKIL